jgi:hypothetical protein
MSDNFPTDTADKKLIKSIIREELKKRDERPTYSGDIERICIIYGIGYPLNTNALREMIEKDKTIRLEDRSYNLV